MFDKNKHEKKNNVVLLKKMEFRTVLNGFSSKFKIEGNDKLFFIGSCFTENIGNQLQRLKFESIINPFGIVYNPISISNSLETLLQNKLSLESDLFEHQGVWHSFDFHSRFSDVKKEKCLEKTNQSITNASLALKNTNVLFITFGSAHVYHLKNQKKTVANCHKLPANHFDKTYIDFNQTFSIYKSLFTKLKEQNPNLKIITTLSPVRYLSDGFAENQKSKAILTLLCHALKDNFEFVDYYPAYEMMMDDLRDYRFYADDMIHPNHMAINYIFNHFSAVYFEKETLCMIQEIEKIKKAMEHKVFLKESEVHKTQGQKMIQQIDALQKKYPFQDFSQEKAFFEY